ncbi:MAG: hypothetical protein HYR85_22295 [Planctomycetes bacterium]|nr:hypothetical protein [Planctomycetota bacterium]MBI3844575.1 hypothetical protein [Planctomycetota bacterium]
MSERSIVCAGCGARYRLPDTFSARQVHCKKCGATIDVEADASPKAAEPERRVVAAAPAPRGTRAPGRVAPTSSAARASARPRPSHQPGSYADRIRQKEPGKLSPAYVISGVAFVVVVAVLIVVFLSLGKKEPAAEPVRATTDTAKATAPPESATPPVSSAEIARRELEQKEKEKKAAEPPKPLKPKVTRYKPQALAFLPDTSEAMKTEINELLATLTNLDLTRESKRAKERLVEIGQPAVPRLLTRLQEIKIDDEQEILVGSLINQTLHDIAGDEVWEKIQYPVQGNDKATLKQREASIQRWFQWWMPIDEEKRSGTKPEEPSTPK